MKSEVRITESDDGGLSVNVTAKHFDSRWRIKQRKCGCWQPIVATDGGSGSHGTFNTRDAALRHVLDKTGVYNDG